MDFSASSPSQNTNLAIISLVFAAISFFFVQPLIQGGLARAVARFHLGEQPTVGDIAEGGLPFIGPVVWVIFLYTLVVLGGLIALIIPGIFFAIRFSFGVPAVVLDELGVYAVPAASEGSDEFSDEAFALELAHSGDDGQSRVQLQGERVGSRLDHEPFVAHVTSSACLSSRLKKVSAPWVAVGGPLRPRLSSTSL